MEDPIEFSSNLSLKPNDQDRYQLAYVTQLYGTMFCVFAKPKCVYSQNKTEAKITEIKFVGVNYKGYVNLELCREHDRRDFLKSISDGEIRDPEQALVVDAPVNVGDNPSGIKIDLWVKPSLGGIPGSIKEMEVTMPLPTELNPLRNGDYIRIERKLLPMGDPPVSMKSATAAVQNRERAFVNGLFDSEFYQRDGLFVKPKVTKTRAENGQVEKFDNRSFVLDDSDACRIIGNPLNPALGAAGADTFKCTPANLKCSI